MAVIIFNYIILSQMEIAYFNGSFLPKDQIHISPEDRGFLFADGIYEVVRWYGGFFFDMESHLSRLKKSLDEVRIAWPGADSFPVIARELIKLNDLQVKQAIVYLQVTRGDSPRSHAFPSSEVHPTLFLYARGLNPNMEVITKGIGALLMKDIRWSRCDIKSVSLLPNILGFQTAKDAGCYESVFVRDGFITECAHSNIFFVIDNVLHTHPESEYILSGVTRKNILHMAREEGILVSETAVHEKRLTDVSEAFITNTSFEIAPVISINGRNINDGNPGPITKALRAKFDAMISSVKV
jgi:D-alanine transaminase